MTARFSVSFDTLITALDYSNPRLCGSHFVVRKFHSDGRRTCNEIFHNKYVHLSLPSIFLCFAKAISNSTCSTEKNRFMGEEQTHIRQSRLNPPDRATTISRLIKHGMNDRQIGPYLCILRHRHIANQYPQSIVHAREHCRNSRRSSLADEVVGLNNVGAGVVNDMPRAGSHYNLGPSRGPDKIGSRAGPGPRAVSCTWLPYSIALFIS